MARQDGPGGGAGWGTRDKLKLHRYTTTSLLTVVKMLAKPKPPGPLGGGVGRAALLAAVLPMERGAGGTSGAAGTEYVATGGGGEVADLSDGGEKDGGDEETAWGGGDSGVMGV